MPIYSLSAAAGAAAEAGGGASGTGAAGARAALGAGGLLAAGGAACADVAAGACDAGAACRVVAVGSGFMMLTGGVDEALGNSALVGLPVGTDDGNPASAAVAGSGGTIAGVFQVGAWRATSVS